MKIISLKKQLLTKIKKKYYKNILHTLKDTSKETDLYMKRKGLTYQKKNINCDITIYKYKKKHKVRI